MHRFTYSSLLILALTLPMFACGDDENVGPNGEQLVSVKDPLFEPTSKTISIGQTVLWTWAGTQMHNVTWEVASTNSPTQATGTFTRMFGTAGTFVYYCTIHGTPTSGMHGTIVVQ